MTNILAGNTTGTEQLVEPVQASAGQDPRPPRSRRARATRLRISSQSDTWRRLLIQALRQSWPEYWAGNSDDAPGHSVMSWEMAAPIWHAFMTEATSGHTRDRLQAASGVTWPMWNAYSGMAPGSYTTKTVPRGLHRRHRPTASGHNQDPVDVDSATNTLWTYDCPGTKVTNGYLNFSQVDANNPVWQKFDQIWASRAVKGSGVKGGPNNGATRTSTRWGLDGRTGDLGGAGSLQPRPCTNEYRHASPATPTPAPTDTAGPDARPTPTPTLAPTPAPTLALRRPPTLAPTPTRPVRRCRPRCRCYLCR